MDKPVNGFRRKARVARWHGAYSAAHPDCVDGCCVYCGGPASGLDHVPPLSFLDLVGERQGLLYRACVVCNTKLSAYPADCLPVRADYLVAVLRREWLLCRNGVKRLFPAERIETTGKALRERIRSGEVRAACRCRRCESNRA